MPKRLLILIQLIPALLFILFSLSMANQYFFQTYLLVSLVFLLGSLMITIFIVRRQQLLLKAPFLSLFFGQLIAWLLALVALALLNLTPLCIGQDNGDGINNLNDCAIQTILAGGTYSLVMVIVIAVAAMLSSLILAPERD